MQSARIFLFSLISFLLLPVVEAQSQQALSTEKPDIVLIIVDTLRADKLAPFGGPAVASPELDSFAREGVKFDRMISQSSWTRASLASLDTGLFPRRAGVRKEQWDVLNSDLETMAEHLKRNGYTTIGVTANPQLNRIFGFAQGFDRYSESTVLFEWMKKEKGKVKAGRGNLMRPARDVFDDVLAQIETPAEPRFIRTLLMEVHAHKRFKDKKIDPDLRHLPDPGYLQAVRVVSREIGDFVRRYREKVSRPTIFIVTSDHGEGLLDHPGVFASREHGNLLYRSHIHIPCIVFGSSQQAGKGVAVKELTRLVDLMPTILELGGVAPPSGLDGVSFRSALKGGELPSGYPRTAFSETAWRKVDKIALTDGEWLFVESRDGWQGTAPRELHRFFEAQNGSSTSKLADNPELALEFESELRALDRQLANQSAGSTGPKSAVPEEAIQQLKSLGYLK